MFAGRAALLGFALAAALAAQVDGGPITVATAHTASLVAPVDAGSAPIDDIVVDVAPIPDAPRTVTIVVITPPDDAPAPASPLVVAPKTSPPGNARA
jgi:hypothetical protein